MIYEQKVILWLCICLVLPIRDTSEEKVPSQIQWLTSLADARAKAAAEKKLIVAYLFADWCPWCKRMDRETWPHSAVVEESRKYVLLRLDGEHDPDGASLRERFMVEGFPGILLLNPDGSEFDRLEGFLTAGELLKRLNLVLEDPDSLGNLRAAVTRAPADAALRYKLGRILISRRDFAGAQEAFEKIVRSDPKNHAQITDQALFYLAMCQAMRSDLQAALTTLDQLERSFPKSALTPRAWFLAGELMLQMGRRDQGRKKIEAFLKNYPDHPLADRARQLLSERY
jgi:tetratricopeptide (TPR) repeat protein